MKLVRVCRGINKWNRNKVYHVINISSWTLWLIFNLVGVFFVLSLKTSNWGGNIELFAPLLSPTLLTSLFVFSWRFFMLTLTYCCLCIVLVFILFPCYLYRTAIQAIAAYLDAFQKIADAATNSRGKCVQDGERRGGVELCGAGPVGNEVIKTYGKITWN